MKTHSSESRGQGATASQRTHVSILQEQTLLKQKCHNLRALNACN